MVAPSARVLTLSACLIFILHKLGNPGNTLSEASWAQNQASGANATKHQQPVWPDQAQLMGLEGMSGVYTRIPYGDGDVTPGLWRAEWEPGFQSRGKKLP